LTHSPQNFTRLKRKQGNMVLAFGRDPYFSGWPDTVQLDYGNQETVLAMTNELLRISEQCDGLRCDMAMLVLPEVFEKTWGRRAQSFWPEAIRKVKAKNPEFTFLAEVYWDMEWELQQLGFDFTYDKRLYDRLAAVNARGVREHLFAVPDYQDKMARFLENHDESRAAATFPPDQHRAAAIITYLSPGMRFFHQGQIEGRRKRISPHLVRAPFEPADGEVKPFYSKLLYVLNRPVFHHGKWLLLKCIPAWAGNQSHDASLAYAWEGPDGKRFFVVVNYADHSSQCYVPLPFPELSGKLIKLNDLMSTEVFHYQGSELISKGLYIDLPAFSYYVFEQFILSDPK